MINSMGKMCAVLALALLIIPAGALAAINTIAAGNTVFLGEENLDIRLAMDGDTQIGWWASAAAIPTTSPSYTIVVSSPSAFFISPTEFSGKLGPWYRINASGYVNGTAFTVSDPNLDIRVMDATLGVDATENGWITTGSEVAFKITTNLYQMGQRTGVAGAPITIKVQAPDGATYSALINKAGATTNIVEMSVPTSPYSTGPIWDTGKSDTYPYGTYRIWAECNANSMKDNYGDVGKTYTASSSLLDQERNPLIGSYYTSTVTRTATATPVPTTVKTTVATTVPATVITTTAEPTTIATAAPTAPPTALPTAAATKSPGFESVLAGAALLLALAFIVRKE
ncbi:MAG: DUF3821 domain-containing protein [Methanoregula sp.]|jgi:hypothetical protein|nr:DUF3821 domain-containing protein [Methanoregula sp.]